MKSFYQHFLFCSLFFLSIDSFAVKYSFPSALSAITNGSAYCQNSASTALSITVTNLNCGTGGAGTDISTTVFWYSNTVLSNTGGTLKSTTSSTTATTTFTYFPSTATVGTLYYYFEITWTDPDGASACTGGSLVSAVGEMASVVINSLPTADAGPNQAICDGGSVVIGGSPTASGGTAPYSYSWSPTTNLSSSTVENPTCNATANTTYNLTVTDNNTCTDFTSVVIAIGIPTCASGFSPADGTTFACGTSTTLSWIAPSGGPNYKIYLETNNPPTILVSTQETTSYATEMLLENTTYYWMIIPTNACGDASGCTVQSFTTSTAINPPAASDVARCGTGTLTLNASGGTYPHYYWYNAPSGGTLLSTSSSYTTPSISNTTTYYVQDENAAPETFNATGLTSTTACTTPPQSTDFDITNNSSTQNVLITKIAVQFGLTTTQQVRIFVRDGTYAGNDGNSSGWILIYMASPRTKQGQTLVLDVSDFCIAPNGIVGVYIWTSNKHYVTTAAGPFSNTDISISNGNVGCTISSPFSTTPQNPGYGLNGAVYYRVLDAGSPCARCISARTPVKAIVDNITTQPANQTACDGSAANFSITASGASLTYQWRKEGINLSDGVNVSGSTTTALIINPVSPSDAANYDVIVSGVCTSNAVSLTVNSNPSPTITAGGATTFCAGGSVTLTSSAATSYLWTGGATTPSISATTSGSYFVTVTDGNGCTGASAASTVTVNPSPTAIVGSGLTICNGHSTIIGVSNLGSASANYSVTWDNGAGSCTGIANNGSCSKTVSPASSTTFTATITDALSCTNTYSQIVTVLVCSNTITTTTISPSPNICRGGNITVNYTITETYNPGNIFTAQLSDAGGSFAAPTAIGNVASTTAGAITATIPSEQAMGTLYRIRVVSSDPGVNGSDNGSNLTVSGNCTYYWIGGEGNWDDPAHWSGSSGGAGGIGIPNIHIDVVIDDNSATGPNAPIHLTGPAQYYTRRFTMTGINGSKTPMLGRGSLMPRPNWTD